MSNYIRGLKRQQIIERWIQGHDDPDFEVFPTKKEGRYIVKKRVEPLGQNDDEEQKPYGRGECLEEVNDEQNDEQNEEPEHEEPQEQKPQPKSKAKPKTQPKRTISKTQPKRTIQTNSSDMTVGI